MVGAEFDVAEASEEVNTLGGYLATRIGRVPVRGELVPGPGPFEIEVLDADPRRVKRVRIHRSRQPADGDGARPARVTAATLAPAVTAATASVPPPEPAAASADNAKPPSEP